MRWRLTEARVAQGIAGCSYVVAVGRDVPLLSGRLISCSEWTVPRRQVSDTSTNATTTIISTAMDDLVESLERCRCGVLPGWCSACPWAVAGRPRQLCSRCFIMQKRSLLPYYRLLPPHCRELVLFAYPCRIHSFRTVVERAKQSV